MESPQGLGVSFGAGLAAVLAPMVWELQASSPRDSSELEPRGMGFRSASM